MVQYIPSNRNFNAGEWTEMLAERSDLEKYQSACSVLENMIVTPHGPAQKMPGTYNTSIAKSADVRLIRFQYTTKDKLILEMGPGYVRFFKNKQPVYLNGTVSAWAANTSYDLGDIVYDSGTTETLYICMAPHVSKTTRAESSDLWHQQTNTIAIADLTVSESTAISGKVRLTSTSAINVRAGQYLYAYFDATYSPGFYQVLGRESAGHLWVDIDLTYSADTVADIRMCPYEIPSPYQTVSDIQYHPVNDVIYMTQGDVFPHKLMRYGDLKWVFEALSIEDGPFRTQDATDLVEDCYVCPSAASAGKIRLVKPGAFGNYVVGAEANVRYSDTVLTSCSDKVNAKDANGNYIDLDTDFTYPSPIVLPVTTQGSVSSKTSGKVTLTKTGAFGSVGSVTNVTFPEWDFTATSIAAHPTLTAIDRLGATVPVVTIYKTGVTFTTYFTAGDYVKIQFGSLAPEFFRVMRVAANGMAVEKAYWEVEGLTTRLIQPYPDGTYTVTHSDANHADLDLDWKCLASGTALTGTRLINTYTLAGDTDLVTVGETCAVSDNGSSKVRVTLADMHECLVPGAWVYFYEVASPGTYTDAWVKILAVDTTNKTIDVDVAYASVVNVNIYLYWVKADLKTPISMTVTQSGPVYTLSSSGPFFDPKHEGALFSLTHYRPLSAGYIAHTFSASSLISATLKVKGSWTLTTNGTWNGIINVDRKEKLSDPWLSVYSSHQISTNVIKSMDEESEAYYRVTYKLLAEATYPSVTLLSESNTMEGIVRIEGVLDSKRATVKILKPVYSMGTTSWTSEWKEGAFSDYNGYPRALTFCEDRLCLGGTKRDPNTIWQSKAGDYENFRAGNEDDDAQIIPINSSTQNQIQWILGRGSKIFVGTAGAEHVLSGSNDEPLTILNMRAGNPSCNGSRGIQPTLTGDSLMFIQRAGKQVREIVYSIESDDYTADDVTILAPQLFESGIVQTAYMMEPFPVLWCVVGDGNLVGISRDRRQNIAACHKHTTTGSYKSICVINGEDDDELWAVVYRNGTTYIERFGSFTLTDEITEQFFVHCGAAYDKGDVMTCNSVTVVDGAEVVVEAGCLATPTDQDGDPISPGCLVRLRGLPSTLASLDYDKTGIYFSITNLVELAGDYISFTLCIYNDYAEFYLPSGIASGLYDGGVGTVEWVLAPSASATSVCLADGEHYMTVAGQTANKLVKGIPYTARVAPMPFNLDFAGGSIRAKQKRSFSLSASLFRSGKCKVGYDLTKMENVDIDDDELFTGVVGKTIGGTFDKDPVLYVESSEPRQLVVRAIIPEYEIGEG